MLKRTGFKRPAVERRALPASVPVRAVALTVFPDMVQAQPKTEQHRNRRLLDLAKGQPCLLRVPNTCQGGTDTTVAAHSNLSIHGKAGARKANDEYHVFGCMACHGWLDQGPAPRAQKASAFMAGHLRQVEQWRLMAVDMGIPIADRKAVLWALDLLNATPMGFPLNQAIA